MHISSEHYIDNLIISKEPVEVCDHNDVHHKLPAHTIIFKNGKHTFRTKGVIKGPGFKSIFHIRYTDEPIHKFLFPLFQQHLYRWYEPLRQTLYEPISSYLVERLDQYELLTDLRPNGKIVFYQAFFRSLPYVLRYSDHFNFDISKLYFRKWGCGSDHIDKLEIYNRPQTIDHENEID